MPPLPVIPAVPVIAALIVIPASPVILAQAGILVLQTWRFRRTACHYGFPPPRE